MKFDGLKNLFSPRNVSMEKQRLGAKLSEPIIFEGGRIDEIDNQGMMLYVQGDPNNAHLNTELFLEEWRNGDGGKYLVSYDDSDDKTLIIFDH